MVTINSNIVWGAANGYIPSGTPNWTGGTHEAVVIAVDTQNGKVYLNDSGVSFGKGMEVPLGAFLNGWQSVDYELTVVSANAQSLVEGDVSAA